MFSSKIFFVILFRKCPFLIVNRDRIEKSRYPRFEARFVDVVICSAVHMYM